MARYFKSLLVLSAALLVGCSQTPTSEYDMSPDFEQGGEVSQATVTAGSIHGSPEPAVTNNSSINTSAVIAVLGLLVLVLLADDVSACSGSGCASFGTN